MTKAVVDTNVAVVANGRGVSASVDCQSKAVKFLIDISEHGCVILDQSGLILKEYEKRLHARGQPGTGDLFYQKVLLNQHNKKRVQVVDSANLRTEALQQAFANGNLKKFHADDRPFALSAVASRSLVSTCTDSDWYEHETGLAACRVRIEFVCGREAAQKKRAIPKKKSPPKRKALRKSAPSTKTN